MKLLVVGLFMACLFAAVLAKGPADPLLHLRISAPGGAVVSLSASTMQRDLSTHPSVIQLKGNVQIKTCCVETEAGKGDRRYLVMRANAADYNEDTGEIEARGVVRLRFEPAERRRGE